jgi:quercetin dioxygenase-like cupin family protein
VDTAALHDALIAGGIPAEIVERADGYDWANGPGDRYGAHRHDYDKALLCLSGAITFDLAESGGAVILGAGDRLDLQAGTLHGAVVGPDGVRCHETHLPAGTFERRDAGS